MIAHIKFKDGVTRACDGTVKDRVTVPWRTIGHILSHVERNNLELVRVDGWDHGYHPEVRR